MTLNTLRSITLMLVLPFSFVAWAEEGKPLPNTDALTPQDDFAEAMVSGMHRYLDARLIEQRATRTKQWGDLFKAPNRTERMEEKRQHLTTILGAVDPRLPVAMNTTATPGKEGPIAEGKGYSIYSVRWPVFEGVQGEGLLIEPKAAPIGSLVMLPDADQAPEDLVGLGKDALRPYALSLAEAGYRIVIPTLIDRNNTWSGHSEVRMTGQPHREFVYRGAFELGRHIIGYEVQKTRSAIDWLTQQSPDAPVGVFGYGEGGLLALYTAALDSRVQATVVSGYFGPREGLWESPIYRNVWSLLNDFGDAEVATLIAPRTLIVETASPPMIMAKGSTPGKIVAPTRDAVAQELARAQRYIEGVYDASWAMLDDAPDAHAGQKTTMAHLHKALGQSTALNATPATPTISHDAPDAQVRMKRQLDELLGWTDYLAEESPFTRKKFWAKADATSVETWVGSTGEYREFFHNEVIGALPNSTMPLNPRTRQVYKTDAYTGYEVMLDVYPEVFAYGILLVPHGIKPGEKRPVVVCQHGLEGRPQDVADPAISNPTYAQYGCRLAEEGFIVYAPQNPYIGKDHFRSLQRKANPLKLSLFSFIVAQHERTLEWLSALPYVDSERIAFYGLSYGGKTAMTVPAILEQYCLSICSGNFNEWVWKTVSRRHGLSYMLHGEYEMFEWNMGNTLNYAEMSWLIFPRPLMLERGHSDGVAPDEWVAYEYARTRRHYNLLGLADETTIEYFDGPHKIHGEGTFTFLHDKLNFPE